MNQPGTNQGIIGILENIPIGIIVLDQDSAISYANNSAMKILEIDLYDLVDRHFLDLIDDKKMRFALEGLQSGITDQTVFEIQVKGKTINVSTRSLDWERFGVNSMLILLEDITKFRELDNIKSDFISTLLHRLRTPLTTIKSSLAMLSHVKNEISPEETKEIVDMCRFETNRLVLFLNDLRDLFLIEGGLIDSSFETGLIPLGPVIEKSILTIRSEAQDKNITIEYDMEDCSSVIEGDAARLRQVFTNVLVNAVTFTPENGRITITVMDETDSVRVSITDTGIGIAPDELEHIFEKHYRADNEITRNVIGYGLGLYISQYFVQRMNGRFCVYSEPGKGSQFDIVFNR